ncbi:MAG: hypothetical protein LBS92_06490, partial [Candidatus Methanoplasma sp.]|jgi:hypothetical protein|nr:hypothetical protein [Candidatus Methanoplasma sp.]
VKAVASTGTFGGWSGAMSGTDNPKSLAVGTTAETVDAAFGLDGNYVTATVVGDGTISPAGSVFVATGGDRTFTFSPRTGATLTDVVVDGVSIGVASSYTFYNVTSAHTIRAVFTVAPIASYTVTAVAGDNATVSPSGSSQVASGGSLTVTFSVASGFEIADVVVDGASRPDLISAGSYTFRNVGANHTITVTAKTASLSLDIEIVGGNGFVEYSVDGGETFTRYGGRSEITLDSGIILRAIPADGYEFVRWDGYASGSEDTLVLRNIKSSVSETLVLESVSEGGTGSNDDILGMSPMFATLMAVVLAALAAGLLLVLFAALAKGAVEVVTVAAKDAAIVGRKKARKGKAYKFSVEGGREVSYRVGDDGAWKEPAPKGGRYEVPSGDVRDKLTIRVR